MVFVQQSLDICVVALKMTRSQSLETRLTSCPLNIGPTIVPWAWWKRRTCETWRAKRWATRKIRAFALNLTLCAWMGQKMEVAKLDCLLLLLANEELFIIKKWIVCYPWIYKNWLFINWKIYQHLIIHDVEVSHFRKTPHIWVNRLVRYELVQFNLFL